MTCFVSRALTGYVNHTYEDRPEQPTDEKRVLMINVLQPLYPITVSVIHKICHDYGKVLRILIFRKNGVQVMVEVTFVDKCWLLYSVNVVLNFVDVIV